MTHDADHRIRDRAYHLWEAAGRPHGRDDEFWRQATAAEHEAAAKEAKPVRKAKEAPPAPKPAAKAAKTAATTKGKPEAAPAKAKSRKKSA